MITPFDTQYFTIIQNIHKAFITSKFFCCLVNVYVVNYTLAIHIVFLISNNY